MSLDLSPRKSVFVLHLLLLCLLVNLRANLLQPTKHKPEPQTAEANCHPNLSCTLGPAVDTMSTLHYLRKENSLS